MKNFWVGLVAIQALLENRLIVEVEGQAGRIVIPRAFERTTRFDFQCIEAAVTVLIDRAARLAAIPAGESPANRGVQSLL
jgi:hypothetical protein